MASDGNHSELPVLVDGYISRIFSISRSPGLLTFNGGMMNYGRRIKGIGRHKI